MTSTRGRGRKPKLMKVDKGGGGGDKNHPN